MSGLHDKTIISHIGLLAKEVAVIRSIFSLVRSLQDAYTFVDSEKVHYADLVFVNNDDQVASQQWQKMVERDCRLVPVMVTEARDQVGSSLTLQRPISLKKLVTILQSVTSTQNENCADEVKQKEMQILVVDDSFPVRKYMEHKLPELASGSVAVDFAESGEDALLKLENADYDLAFLDVIMPGIDGYKLCKWIKAHRPCYVVMLTSKKSPFDKVRGTLSGCDTYLTKPPEDNRLQAILEKRLSEQAH